MPDSKQYLIEILLRAREQVSQAARNAVKALDDVARSQGRLADASKYSDELTRREIVSLEQMRQARIREKRDLEDQAAALRKSADARRREADASTRSLKQLQKQARIEKALAAERENQDRVEIAGMRAKAAELNAFGDKSDKATRDQISQLRREATAFDTAARQESAVNRKRASELDLQIARRQQDVRDQVRQATELSQASRVREQGARSLGSEIRGAENDLRRYNKLLDNNVSSSSRASAAMRGLGRSAGESQSGVRGLNSEFQGFQVALFIKYIQSIITAVVALGAQLVAVASAAVQAGAGIAGALAAGAAQAVPVIGVLAAALFRVKNVLQAVKLSNQQQLAATKNSTTAARAQRTAAEQVASAQQQVADAHRNTARAIQQAAQTTEDAQRQERRAQLDVTQARKDAIRTVQDLIDAEKQAQLSVEGAQASLRSAVQSGDIAGVAQAQLGLQEARTGRARARQDAAPVRARGVEGVQAVQQAEQSLSDTRRQNARQEAAAAQSVADAQRSEQQAEQNLNRVRRDGAASMDQQSASADKLKDTLRLLSPAERELYTRILRLQQVYKAAARPITDIITRAFTGVVDVTIAKLRDPRILRAFRGIATAIASSIRSATREASGPASTNAFEVLSAEAVRNIPIVTRILTDFFRATRNLVLDAVPAFRLLLTYVEGYAKQALNASRNSRGITNFFTTGVRYAKAFFDLGLAVVRLFLAIGGRGGAAAEGARTINYLTGVVDGVTRKVQNNAGAVRRFFRESGGVLHDLLRVVGAIGGALIHAFHPNSVKAFSDFMIDVIIPAISNAVAILGFLVNTFHQLASLPGVSMFLQFGATVLILGKGLTVIRNAFKEIFGILPALLRSFGFLTAEADAAAISFAGLNIAMGGIILIAILAIVAAIALLNNKFHFLGPTLKWLKGVATGVFDALKAAGEVVLHWISDVWTQGLLYWIRWPFVKLFELVPWSKVFGAIKDAARAVIGFFSHTGGGGVWGTLHDIITAPFRGAVAIVKLIFRGLKDSVIVVLDVIAGRFGDAGKHLTDLFNGVLDTLAGAATSFLGIWQGILDALSHVPGFGWAKGAADAIKHLRGEMDDWRKTLRGSKDSQDDATKAVKASIPQLVRLHDRYENAKSQLDKLRPGTDSYKDAVKRADRAHQNYNDALRNTAKRAGGAQEPVQTLKQNIQNLGGVSADTAQAIAENLNDVLRQVGAKVIKLNTRAYKRSGIDAMTRVTGHAATGGVLSPSGVRRRLFGGGITNPYGGAADDHLVISPTGMPIAAFSGTEGILNAPQMSAVDTSLAINKAQGLMPWGSLNELWGSGMRHYQGGGGLQPGIRALSNRLDRMFGLVTTSGYRTSMPLGHPDYHNQGLAADISGSSDAMGRASRYITSSGIWRSLLEGIHNQAGANLSVKNGQRVDPGFWGAGTWAAHANHIHIALGKMLAGMAGALQARVRTPRFTGLQGAGALGEIAQGSARTLARAANRYIDRVMARTGGGDTRGYPTTSAYSGPLNRVFPAHSLANAAGHVQLSPRQVGNVAAGAGLPRSMFTKIARGESSYYPGIVSSDGGYGLWQMTPRVWGAAALAFMRRLGGLRQMLNPVKNALMARYLYDNASSKVPNTRGFPWFGTRYLRAGGMLRRQGGGSVAGGFGRTVAQTPIFRGRKPSTLLDRIGGLMVSVDDALSGLTAGRLRRVKDLGKRIRGAFEKITEDGGVLDQIDQAVQDIATKAQTRLQNRQFRVGAGGPRRVYRSPAQLAQDQLGTLQTQRSGLVDEQTTIEGSLAAAQRALHEAQRRKNSRAAAQARAAITNLRARLDKNRADLAQNAQDQVEAQESFQQALVDSVNNAAQAQMNALDRATRLAQLGGVTNYSALGSILGQRQNVLLSQRAGLQGALGQAQRTGNVDLVNSLIDQIGELTTQLAENAQAIRDNTDAAFNARTQAIQSQSSFATGIFGSAQSFFQSLGQSLGIDTTGQQRTALQGSGSALATAQGGLKSQLAALLGYTPAEAASLQSLSGGDLVSYVESLASGPAFDSIMARLDPTQQASFQDLLSALIDNATATQQNTDALDQLSGATNAQSFTSSFWSQFRTAIFTGAGGLLPQYQMTVPGADVGARVVASGALMVHAGESVRPASVARDWHSQSAGDTYNVNVTSPTEVLDPTDVGRRLAFYRKTSGG